MINSIIVFSAGISAGILISMLILRIKAESHILTENVSRFGMEDTEHMIAQSAVESGWKIPKIHDLRETMQNNGFTVQAIKVIEICKPEHAYEILSKDHERIASSLMPCRIAIYLRPDGKVYISRLNAGLIGSLMNGNIPKMMKLAAKETEEILKSTIINK